MNEPWTREQFEEYYPLATWQFSIECHETGEMHDVVSCHGWRAASIDTLHIDVPENSLAEIRAALARRRQRLIREGLRDRVEDDTVRAGLARRREILADA